MTTESPEYPGRFNYTIRCRSMAVAKACVPLRAPLREIQCYFDSNPQAIERLEALTR